MNQKITYILLSLFILFTCASLILNVWLLSQRNFSNTSQVNRDSTPNEKVSFFESVLGSAETELVAKNGDELTFKNTKGTSLPFKLTSGVLIVNPDGTATSSTSQLKEGSKALLTARISDEQNEITSINLNGDIEAKNQKPTSSISPVPYISQSE